MLLLSLALFLSIAHQTYAETNRLSLMLCAVNCIHQPDCDYFVFKRTANSCAYRPSSFVPLIDISDELNTTGRWTKMQISSQRSEEKNSNNFRWYFELKYDDCARPKYLAEDFNKYYPKNKIMFTFMGCYMPTLVNNGNSIVCYNKGSWDIDVSKCYPTFQTGFFNSKNANVKLKRQLQVGSRIKVYAPVLKGTKCNISLVNRYKSETILKAKLEFLQNRTTYSFDVFAEKKGGVTGEEGPVDRLDVTISLLETNYELEVLGQKKLQQPHGGDFVSVTNLQIDHDLPLNLIQILF